MKKFAISTSSFAVFAILAFAGTAIASHSWGGYHWARQSNPFTLKLGDDVSGAWDAALATASGDWSVSDVLNTTIVSGLSNPKNCKSVSGRVEICNSKYGNNGWLGIAQIWVTGGVHITAGTVKLNDTYFNTSRYNTVAWRNLVVCQEVGHTFGLDHQDENFNNANLGTCMDYTGDPTGTLGTNGTLDNEHPNAHDYEELDVIYAHTDSFTTILSTVVSKIRNGVASGRADENSELGVVVRRDGQGKPSVYEKDLGRGDKLVTHIFWTE